MSSRVLGRNGVPSVMLNENTCLAGVGWLKRHVELGALLRGEAGLAPREDELLRWGPGTDDADNERRAVLVRLDEPAALATLESKSAAATFAELEETVRLPPLADLRREASKRLGWFARDPGCHQDARERSVLTGDRECAPRRRRAAPSMLVRRRAAIGPDPRRALGTAGRRGLEYQTKAGCRRRDPRCEELASACSLWVVSRRARRPVRRHGMDATKATQRSADVPGRRVPSE